MEASKQFSEKRLSLNNDVNQMFFHLAIMILSHQQQCIILKNIYDTNKVWKYHINFAFSYIQKVQFYRLLYILRHKKSHRTIVAFF